MKKNNTLSKSAVVKVSAASSKKSTSAPVASSRNMYGTQFSVRAGSMPDSIRITGHEYIGSLSVTSTTGVATVIRKDYISPGGDMFAGTRLEMFSQLYEKYLFKRIKFNYASNSSALNNQGLIFAYDKDPLDQDPPSSELGMRYLMAKQNSMMINSWDNASYEIKLTDQQKFYFTNPVGGSDDRLNYQGVNFIASTSTNSSGPLTLGQLSVDYEIELFDPTLDLPLDYSSQFTASAQSVSSTTNAAWNNIPIKNTISDVIPITDVSGNKGWELSGGTYIIEQFGQVASAAIGWLQPVANALIASQPIQWFGILNSAAAGAGAGLFRMDKIVVPSGGATLFGQASATTNIAAGAIRILKAYQSTDI